MDGCSTCGNEETNLDEAGRCWPCSRAAERSQMVEPPVISRGEVPHLRVVGELLWWQVQCWEPDYKRWWSIDSGEAFRMAKVAARERREMAS